MWWLKLFNRYIDFRWFCAEVCGRLVEVRVRSFGRRSVHVDGVLVVDKPVIGLGDDVIQLSLPDGTSRRAVIRVTGTMNWAEECRIQIQVDGDDPIQLQEVTRAVRRGRCPKCRYDLNGLGQTGGLVMCPECGTRTGLV